MMISVFIASEPGWQCVNNSTCSYTDTINLGDDRYKHRCDIPREDWKFADDFTSIVTEVNTITDLDFRLGALKIQPNDDYNKLPAQIDQLIS